MGHQTTYRRGPRQWQNNRQARPSRPAPKPRKPKGPAKLAPTDPVSRNEWSRMLKGTALRLSALIGVHAKVILGAPAGDLWDWHESMRGLEHNRPGRAARLIVKLLRLRNWTPAAVSPAEG